MGCVSALYNVSRSSGFHPVIAQMMATVGSSIIRRHGRSITGCIFLLLHFQMRHSLSTILRIVAETESYIQIIRCLISRRNVPNRSAISIRNIPSRSRFGDSLRVATPLHNVAGRCVISCHNVSNRARYGDMMRCAISCDINRADALLLSIDFQIAIDVAIGCDA